MKKFALFMTLWLTTILLSFNIYKEASIKEMLKMVLATQLSYIIYNLLKENLNESN